MYRPYKPSEVAGRRPAPRPPRRALLVGLAAVALAGISRLRPRPLHRRLLHRHRTVLVVVHAAARVCAHCSALRVHRSPCRRGVHHLRHRRGGARVTRNGVGYGRGCGRGHGRPERCAGCAGGRQRRGQRAAVGRVGHQLDHAQAVGHVAARVAGKRDLHGSQGSGVRLHAKAVQSLPRRLLANICRALSPSVLRILAPYSGPMLLRKLSSAASRAASPLRVHSAMAFTDKASITEQTKHLTHMPGVLGLGLHLIHAVEAVAAGALEGRQGQRELEVRSAAVHRRDRGGVEAAAELPVLLVAHRDLQSHHSTLACCPYCLCLTCMHACATYSRHWPFVPAAHHMRNPIVQAMCIWQVQQGPFTPHSRP